MKTVTRKYKVFDFEELTQEAKDKAREKWNEDSDYPFLQDDLREYIHEELQTLKLKEENVITPYYSLSYCQGDGLMFEAVLSDKKGNTYTIKQSGHYYHEKSTEITGENKKGEEIDTEKWEEKVYIPLCKRIRDRGYNEIEYQESEEYFGETCKSNEYTFLKDGTMFN